MQKYGKSTANKKRQNKKRCYINVINTLVETRGIYAVGYLLLKSVFQRGLMLSNVILNLLMFALFVQKYGKNTAT